MKKLTKVLALVAMAAALFIGCSNSSSSGNGGNSDPKAPEAKVIWDAGHEIANENWAGADALVVPAASFADIAVGGTIEVYAKGTAQLKAGVTDWPALPALASQVDSWGNVYPTEKVTFVLGEQDVKLIKEGGLVLFGAKVKYTKVTYTPAK